MTRSWLPRVVLGYLFAACAQGAAFGQTATKPADAVPSRSGRSGNERLIQMINDECAAHQTSARATFLKCNGDYLFWRQRGQEYRADMQNAEFRTYGSAGPGPYRLTIGSPVTMAGEKDPPPCVFSSEGQSYGVDLQFDNPDSPVKVAEALKRLVEKSRGQNDDQETEIKKRLSSNWDRQQAKLLKATPLPDDFESEPCRGQVYESSTQYVDSDGKQSTFRIRLSKLSGPGSPSLGFAVYRDDTKVTEEFGQWDGLCVHIRKDGFPRQFCDKPAAVLEYVNGRFRIAWYKSYEVW